MGIFSANGILGLAEHDLTAELFEQVGRAYAITLRNLNYADRMVEPPSRLDQSEKGSSTHSVSSIEQIRARQKSNMWRPKVMVAGDARLSTPVLKNALMKGLLAEHCIVYNLGCTPTPILRFAMNRMGVENGLMVGAASQASDYNGLKFYCENRPMLPIQLQMVQNELAEIQKPEQMNISPRRPRPLSQPAYAEMDIQLLDMVLEYCKSLVETINMHQRVHVIVDGSNGCAGEPLANMLEMLECRIERLNTLPDGKFQAHNPDPSDNRNMDNLIQRVRKSDADLGICLDSDGTHMGMVLYGGKPVSSKFIVLSATEEKDQVPGENEDALLCSLRVVEAISNHREAIRHLGISLS